MFRRVAPGIAKQVRFFSSHKAGEPVSAGMFKKDLLSASQLALNSHLERLPVSMFQHEGHNNTTRDFAPYCAQSLIAPEPVDAVKLIEMGCTSKTSPAFYNQKPGDMKSINALGLVEAFSPLRTVVENYLQRQLVERTTDIPFTHSTKTADSLRLILAENKLENRNESTGVASQPGICMSTDVLAISACRALCGELGHHMIFYSLPGDASLKLSKSMYDLSDKMTLVSKAEQLPILPYAFFDKSNNQLEIIDPVKFTDGPLASIVVNYHILEHQYAFNLAAFINEFNIEFVSPEGEKIPFEKLIKKSIDEIYQILEKTLSDLKETIGNKSFKEKVYFEAIHIRLGLLRKGLCEALKRHEIQNVLLARPQLKILMEEAAYPEHKARSRPEKKP